MATLKKKTGPKPVRKRPPEKSSRKTFSDRTIPGPVFLVEPNREMLGLIELFLGPEFQIVAFESLDDALHDSRMHEASVLLCGVPKLEETQTLRALEQMHQKTMDHPLPVLALLYEGETNGDENLHPVFSDILPAPFTVARLRQKISTLLN